MNVLVHSRDAANEPFELYMCSYFNLRSICYLFRQNVALYRYVFVVFPTKCGVFNWFRPNVFDKLYLRLSVNTNGLLTKCCAPDLIGVRSNPLSFLPARTYPLPYFCQPRHIPSCIFVTHVTIVQYTDGRGWVRSGKRREGDLSLIRYDHNFICDRSLYLKANVLKVKERTN